MSRVVVVPFFAVIALSCAACDSTSDAETSAQSPKSSTSAVAGQETVTKDDVNDLADQASQAADLLATEPLLRIRNKTSQPVVLRSGNGDTSMTVAAGKSIRLMSQRACRWTSLTANTEEGQFVDKITEPCDRQTWDITGD